MRTLKNPAQPAHAKAGEVKGAASAWMVYIVRCADGTLYTGIATDVMRRVEEHNSSNLLAASYTRGRRPVVLVYQEAAPTRSTASKREYEIKQLSRADKEALLLTSAPRRKGRRVHV
ncbi:MAG TPA: GIY-YIG nuclease family protein [Burkholderiales bacterium]|nr:GIY-YIG nuclease family protein [Burkholderiales bacterium]